LYVTVTPFPRCASAHEAQKTRHNRFGLPQIKEKASAIEVKKVQFDFSSASKADYDR
jgi:hypothetical protein